LNNSTVIGGIFLNIFVTRKNPLKFTLAQVEGYCRTAGLKEVSAEATSVENGQRNGSATLLRVMSRQNVLDSSQCFLLIRHLKHRVECLTTWTDMGCFN